MGDVVIIKFPTSATPVELRAGAPHKPDTAHAPARPACKTCGDEGFITGCGTNNPSERAKTIECPDCDGGYRFAMAPCSDTGCYCWFPLEDAPDEPGRYGLCGNDEYPEPIRSGVGFSAWREALR